MKTYVCNFCGGDHGATECEEDLCFHCLKANGQCDCQCDCPEYGISAREALELLNEIVWAIIPQKDIDALDAEFDSSLPVEFYAKVVNRYPEFPGWIQDLFPAPPAGDERIWDASRKYGACYEFAFKTLVYNSELVRQLAEVSKDEEIYLVHGFGREPEFADVGHFNHAWLEVDDAMVDCGTMHHRLIVLDREAKHAECDVCHTTRFTAKQALRLMVETLSYGPWEELPTDLVLANSESLSSVDCQRKANS
mgnify:CR=1 FL=1